MKYVCAIHFLERDFNECLSSVHMWLHKVGSDFCWRKETTLWSNFTQHLLHIFKILHVFFHLIYYLNFDVSFSIFRWLILALFTKFYVVICATLFQLCFYKFTLNFTSHTSYWTIFLNVIYKLIFHLFYGKIFTH